MAQESSCAFSLFDPHRGLACRLGRFAHERHWRSLTPHAEINGSGWIPPGRKFQPFFSFDPHSHDLVHEISHLFCGLFLLLPGGVGVPLHPAQADTIGGKVAQLRREYRESHDKMLKEQMENWKEIEASLRHQGLDFLRRGERRKNQMEVL